MEHDSARLLISVWELAPKYFVVTPDTIHSTAHQHIFWKQQLKIKGSQME